MKVTLKDIAKDTGYSVSTVSRALRGDKKINSNSEKKIVESAKRLNYPHLRPETRHVRSNTPHFAIISDFQEGEFYSAFYSGFNKASKTHNVMFGLYSFAEYNRKDDIIKTIETLEDKGYNGAVLFIPYFEPKHYKTIINNTSSGFSMISISILHQPVMDTISFDAYSGGHRVASHFHERGYSNTGILLGPRSRPEALLRANGFSDYCHQHDQININWTFDGDYSVKSGQNAFKAFMKSNKKPRAIFASNDDMAIGFMQSALSQGLRIPDDVAIAGYDDLRISRILHPTLTSVSTDYEQLALNVSRQLLNRLNNQIEHQGFLNLIPVSLKIRESS